MKQLLNNLIKNGGRYMKKLKNITIKTGTADEFMARVKNTMHAADEGKSIQPLHTLTFEEPTEMLHFLSKTKVALMNVIRKHPGSITHIAKTIKRNRAAVYRDIHEMELFGLVRTHEEINPGHGRHKIVEVSAPTLKLEAYL
jgi:predicted transcriptional regulator